MSPLPRKKQRTTTTTIVATPVVSCCQAITSQKSKEQLPLLRTGTSPSTTENESSSCSSFSMMVRLITVQMLNNDVNEVNSVFVELNDMLDDDNMENNDNNNNNNSEMLVKMGGPSFVIAFMKKWTESKIIQAYGCAILAKCFQCCVDDEDERNIIFQVGAADVALSSMKKFPDDDSVQCNACFLLSKLAKIQEYAKYLILECDDNKNALHLVCQSMTKFPKYEPLQNNACGFLMRTSAVPELRTPMIQSGALDALSQLIKTWIHPTTDKQKEIQLAARLAIRQLLTETS